MGDRPHDSYLTQLVDIILPGARADNTASLSVLNCVPDLVAAIRAARAERDEARRDIERIHRMLGRDNHGPEANTRCVVDAIVSMQLSYGESEAERDQWSTLAGKLRADISRALIDRAGVDARDDEQRVEAVRGLARERDALAEALRAEQDRWLTLVYYVAGCVGNGLANNAERIQSEMRRLESAARAALDAIEKEGT